MAATLGKIDPFDPEVERWPEYVERLDQYLEANDIVGEGKQAKRRAVLISVMGPAAYKLARNLLSPAKPTEKTYEDIVTVLTKHYSSVPTEVMQRFRFNSRSRKAGETVAAFVAELRRLAEHCNYGDTLEKMLRDRLVSGVNEEAIQRKLLAERELTYDSALRIAQGLETAAKDLKEMQNPGAGATPTVKNEPTNNVQTRPNRACHRCGVQGHFANKCQFKGSVCHKCGKTGHLARVCHSKPDLEAKTKKPTNRPVRQVAELDEEADDQLLLESQPIQQISEVTQGRGRQPPITVQVGVDECTVTMEVDTGASTTIMPEPTYHKFWPGRGLSQSSVKLQNYSKDSIPVVGSTTVQVCYEGQTAELPLIVVKGSGSTLLGRNWLHSIKLNWSQICSVKCTELRDILSKYDQVFQEGLGIFSGVEAHLEVDPEATPRFHKARSVPYAMRQAVEDELDRLVKEGTLEPVEYSDWATPLVSVWKSDNKSVRICGDFRITINPVSKLEHYPIPRIEDLFAKLEGGKTFIKLDLSQAYQQLKLDEGSKKYTVVNTQKGLFRYTRLPYGISSAGAIFQRAMENLAVTGNPRGYCIHR